MYECVCVDGAQSEAKEKKQLKTLDSLFKKKERNSYKFINAYWKKIILIGWWCLMREREKERNQWGQCDMRKVKNIINASGQHHHWSKVRFLKWQIWKTKTEIHQLIVTHDDDDDGRILKAKIFDHHHHRCIYVQAYLCRRLL